MSYTQQQSPLHFPLSSPPLHIPPSLETLDAPTSKGYRFGVRRSSDGRKSVDETHASVESWRVGMASRSFKFDDKVRLSTLVQSLTMLTTSSQVDRRPSLRLSNHRRTSSLFSLDLPHLSRTNSASTCSSQGTPPYSSWDPEVRVVSEEDEEDAFAQEPVKRSVVHPPTTTVKRPGLTRRDTPIPPRDLEQPIRKPSKGFTSSLTAPTSPSVVASPVIAPTPTAITASPAVASSSKAPRPPLVRRDTPHPAFDPSLASRMPNFFSSSLRASLQRTSTTSPRDVTPYAPRMVPLTGLSPESVASDSFEEEEVVPLPVVTRGRTMARGRFRSVVDDKLWIAV
jgi:hypothetical protein